MRRWLSLLVLVAALAPVGARPAEAHVDYCVGGGTLVTSAGMGYPVVFPSSTVGFNAALSFGFCMATGATFTMSGTFVGNCYAFTGAGTTSDGHAFAVVGAGGTLTFTGDVVGNGTITPDFTVTGSCAVGTATRFLIQLSVVKFHFGGGGTFPSRPPDAPTLVAPGDNATFTTRDLPVFTINAVDPGDDDDYTGTVELQRAGDTVIRVSTTPPASSGSNASTTFGNLPPGDYEWRARARDLDGESGYSETRSFTVTLS